MRIDQMENRKILSLTNYYNGKLPIAQFDRYHNDKISLIWDVVFINGYRSQFIHPVVDRGIGYIDVDDVYEDTCFLRECYKHWREFYTKNTNDEHGTIKPLAVWAKQVVLRDRNAVKNARPQLF